MARLEFRGQTYQNEAEVQGLLAKFGVPYERWGVRGQAGAADEQVLTIYDADIKRLMSERNYLTADLIALKPTTPNLDVICAKFDKEHQIGRAHV